MEKQLLFCCVCITEDGHMENVTKLDENGISYSDKLALCDPQQAWENDQLWLCSNCVTKLNLVYDFINFCKRSEQLRLKKLNKVTKEAEKRKVENEEFTCDLCKKKFKKKRFLKGHITRIHVYGGKRTNDKDEDIKTSELNDSQTSSASGIQTTTIIPPEEGSLKSTPDEYFSSNENEMSSDKDDTPKTPKTKRKRMRRPESFTCEYCGKHFNRHQHWAAHMRSKHTFEKPYKCSLCDASFTTSHSLLVHKRNHNNEKPYICSICGKGFVCSGDLFHHNQIHLNKKEYECHICNKRFNTSSILRTHKIVKHTEPHEWKYVCMLCERRFPINSSFSLHMKRHAGIKDHACHICGNKFFSKSEVVKHIRCHSDQKSFKCELCEDKQYKHKEGLDKHLKLTHNLGNWKPPKLEKKFLCDFCPKKFPFNNKLQRHLLTHTGEKPFKCNFCDKKFSNTTYRKNHMRKEHSDRYDEDMDIVRTNYTKYDELVAIEATEFL